MNEVKNLAPKDIKIKILAPPERMYSCWIGGPSTTFFFSSLQLLSLVLTTAFRFYLSVPGNLQKDVGIKR